MWRQLKRVKPGLKMADLATEMDVSPSWLSSVLSGRRPPSLSLAYRLGRRLGIPIEEIAELHESVIRQSPHL